MARPKSRAESIISAAEPYIGTKEAAALLGVSVSTIQKMVEAGTLRAWKTQGGHRRISANSVTSLKRSGMASPTGDNNGRLQVLVVEDNATMIKAYTKALSEWGSGVNLYFAGDGAAALLAIAQRRPDLVITDLAMEPFDGFHLIKTLRGSSDLAETAILVVTGLSDEEIKARGGLDDATLCYRKPLSFQRLGGYIDGLMQARQRT
jgi:excisionase family DNA binding protein